MDRKQKAFIIGALILLALLLLFWGIRRAARSRSEAPSVSSVAVSTSTPSTAMVPSPQVPAAAPRSETTRRAAAPREVSRSTTTAAPRVAVPSTPTIPTTAAPPLIPPVTPTPTFVVPPGQEGMHRELIPKTINIVRCYYDQDVVAPESRFNFDINGSGFTEQFQHMIRVDPDALDVEVKNLVLVTANQIRGEMVVGPEATTQYIYPKIIIRGLPVFRAPDPFGVVRRGEVLDIQLVAIDQSGQMGKFRVVTNLNDALAKKFRVEPTTPKLEITSVKNELPFYINGVIQISPGLTNGHYGLVAYQGTHELFRKDPLVDVVKPNVGRGGSVDSVKATELAHRPGDRLAFTVKGSGFSPADVSMLALHIDGYETGPATFTYVNGGLINGTLQIPPNLPTGVYGVTLKAKGKTVFQHDSVFGIVPPNWYSGVSLVQPVMPGASSTLQLSGRDISFAQIPLLRLEVDDPGIHLSPLRLRDASTILCDIQVSTSVAPGDYIIHVYSNGKPLKLPRGNIIKIGS